MKRTKIIILYILICLNILFIWGNSLQVSEVSNAASDTVAEAVRPVAEPILQPVTSSNGRIFGYTYNAFIRKAAHVLEFFTLGALLFMLARNRFDRIPLILLIALATAVADETIQIFNGRTDSVKDILIDFGGSAAGIAITAALTALISALIKKKARK